MAERKRGRTGAAGKAPKAKKSGKSAPTRAKTGARGLAAAREPAAKRPASTSPAANAPGRAKPVAKPARSSAKPAAPAAKGAAARSPKVKATGAAPRAAAKAGPEVAKAAPKRRRPARRARGMAARPPLEEPDPDGYFVARVRGEEAVRDAPHPMTEAAMESARGAPRTERREPRALFEEALGELPWSYGDDAFVALPRDPRTLFLYWDHASETTRRAWEGIDGGRAEIWVFAELPGGGWERVRVVEFALEARAWYVHDLDPGRVYRAEIHVVDARQDRLLPAPSNPVLLPGSGPSPVVDDRFARIPWGEQLSRLLPAGRAGLPFSEELRAQLLRLSDWSRFGGEAGSGGAGGMGGRPFSPTAPPGSPSSPWGGGR